MPTKPAAAVAEKQWSTRQKWLFVASFGLVSWAAIIWAIIVS